MSPHPDVISYTASPLIPGVARWGSGWYLVATNDRVEAGPFTSLPDAALAAWWLEDHSLGSHPAPWGVRWSASRLLVGSRTRDRSTHPTTPTP